MIRRLPWRPIVGALLLLTLIIIVAQTSSGYVEALFTWLRENQLPWMVYFVALLTLPLLGVPMSLFCMFAGAQYGLVAAMFMLAVALFLHQCLCYAAMHTWVKPRIERWLSKQSDKMPRWPEHRPWVFALRFAAVPVFPYMVKNLVLATGPLNLRQYLAVNLPVQWLYGIPFSLFSDAVTQQNWLVVMVSIVLMLSAWLLPRWL